MIEVPLESELHVSKFFPSKQRRHAAVDAQRQGLILYLAHLHATATSLKRPLGFCELTISLSGLREWVYDYERAFDKFFRVVKTGYHVNDDVYELSTIVPIPRPATSRELIERVSYVPPPVPSDGVKSRVTIRKANRQVLVDRLTRENRIDLVLPVKWLLDGPTTVFFYFEPTGKLKQRDRCTYPIKGIETWPGWLREELFGGCIDIDSAYTQFLVTTLHQAFEGDADSLGLRFPDLIRLKTDKVALRAELRHLLGLPINDVGTSIIKKVLMGLANGSRISGAMLVTGSRSAVGRLIAEHSTLPLTGQLDGVRRLERIAEQYATARKMVCSFLLKAGSSRRNIKRVFGSYFEWERAARYAIWEMCDRQGIMMHDGIDGIPDTYLKDIDRISREVGLRLTVG